MHTKQLLLAGLALAASTVASAVPPRDYWMPLSKPSGATAYQGVSLVNAADLANVQTFLADTAVINRPMVHEAFDIVNGDAVDPRPHALVYARGGKWFRVSLRTADAQTARRISSESQLGGLCGSTLFDTRLSNPNAALLVYSLKGPDGSCYTADDLFRLTPLNATSTEMPTALQIKSLSVFPMYSARHVLQGFLAREGSEVKLYDALLGNPMPVLSGVTAYSVMGSAPGGAFVHFNGTVRRIGTAGDVSAALHTVSAGAQLQSSTQNPTTLFFSEHATDPMAPVQGRMFRLPLTGGSPSTLMLEAPSQVYPTGTTNNALLFNAGGEFDSTTFTYRPTTLNAIDKAAASGSPAPVQIDSVPQGYIFVQATAGQRVYYEISNFNTDTTIARIRTDSGSSVRNYGAGSSFAGGVINGGGAGQHGAFSNLLLVTGQTGNDLLGATLSNLPVGTGTPTPVTLTTFTEPVSYTSAFGFGGSALGSLDIGGATPQDDVFAVDFVTSQFVRITSTPGDEQPLH